MKRFLFLLGMVVPFISCHKESNDVANLVNINDRDFQGSLTLSCSQPDSTELTIAFALGAFFDEIAEQGLDTFNSRHSLMMRYLDRNGLDLVSVEESIEIYRTFHNMDSLIVSNFFDIIGDTDYRSVLLSEEHKECIIAGLYLYSLETSELDYSQNKDRFVFSTLAQLAGAHCGWVAFGGIMDAALEAAAAVTLSPTGVGLAIGLASAASSYASAVHTALNCN